MTVCQKTPNAGALISAQVPAYEASLVTIGPTEKIGIILYALPMLVICQRDGRMQSFLENRHFCAPQARSDAGFVG